MMLETESSQAIPQSDFKARETYYRELEKALPVLVKYSPLQFLEWLESTDEQVRFVAIETLSQFSDEIVEHTGTIPNMLNRHILMISCFFPFINITTRIVYQKRLIFLKVQRI